MQLGRQYEAKFSPSDVVNATLFDAYQQRERFRGESEAELAAWLRRVLACNLADAFRALGRAKRDIAREQSLHLAIEQSCSHVRHWFVGTQTSPSAHAARNEELLRLARALESLPSPQRQAVQLHHLQGCSLAETAEHLGRSDAAVAGLLRRGLRRLRQLLDPPTGSRS
jgi:RNA polymerase sigma-70 factor (ECF subfamily)